MYDLGVWKIIFLWHESGMGNIEVPVNCCAAAAYPDRTGVRRADFHSISNTDCGGNRVIGYKLI